MRKRNPKNERIKRDYLIYLADAQGRSKATQDQAMAVLSAFEASTAHKDFALFHIEQARAFKRQLSAQRYAETKAPLATATIHARLMAVKAFFHWLVAGQGYRRLNYGDVEYFNPSTKDAGSRPPSASGPRLASLWCAVSSTPCRLKPQFRSATAP